MPALFSLCVVAILLWSTGAGAACVFNKRHKCVDFSAIPDIAQQVIGPAKLPSTKKPVPPPVEAAAPQSTYNGPTIGFSTMIRRAPEIGYHWSTN